MTTARRSDDPSHQPGRRRVPLPRPAEAAPGPVAGWSAPDLARLQRLAGNAAVSRLAEEEGTGTSPVLGVVGRGGGRPLDAALRTEMEGRLGAGFGDVRIHTDAVSAVSARSVQARAYTVGNEIVFDEGVYEPSSPAGRRTLAHELTHVIQQREGPVDGTTWSMVQPPLLGPADVAETPGSRGRTASAARCSRAGTRTCNVPGAPGPKAPTTWS